MLLDELKAKVSHVKRVDCTNNTQKVLLSLLRTRNKTGWVSRKELDVPSLSARVSELRSNGFQVASATGSVLGFSGNSKNVTYYRLVPESVNFVTLNRTLKGVM